VHAAEVLDIELDDVAKVGAVVAPPAGGRLREART
jgi:hypothetical protein